MRSIPGWIGKTDDEAIPARVKVRVFDRFGGCCAICTTAIRGGVRPAYDHMQAIINGGANSEANLQLLCSPCHLAKTNSDVSEKSTVYRKRVKHLGIRKPSRFACSRSSKFKRKITGEVVLR